MSQSLIGPIVFLKRDYAHFEKWLNLDYEALTWQGRFRNDFNQFWDIFFVEGLSLGQLIDRFHFCLHSCEAGPLSSWLKWLMNHLVVYSFLNKESSIKEISLQTGLSLSEVSLILRNFFVEKCPFLEDELSDKFQVNHLVSPNVNLTFEKLCKESSINLKEATKKAQTHVMASLEVTLYKEFKVLTDKMISKLFHPNLNLKKIKRETNWKLQLKFWRDVVSFLFVGAILIFIVQQGNRLWENYLSEKISIYEPKLQWLDKSLVFRSNEEIQNDQNISNLPTEEGFEELDEVEGGLLPSIQDNIRYEPESEVELTSLENLPLDFDEVDLETSRYEESSERGYRDSRYGNIKVYRVLMRTQDTFEMKKQLAVLLQQYKVSQADNVLPGTLVPGGMYYNLYVPRKFLKEFMAQISDIGEAVLYESRVRLRDIPKGKTKVFIWVKRI